MGTRAPDAQANDPYAAELVPALEEHRQLRLRAGRHRRLWVERLVANGVREIGSFDGLNDVDNMLVALDVARRLGASTIGALSYCLSPVHTDALYVKTAKALVERGKVDAIWIKDAGGLLTVDRIRTLVPALRKVVGRTPIELHSHCLTGVAPLVYLEGVKAGADRIHTSIAPWQTAQHSPRSSR